MTSIILYSLAIILLIVSFIKDKGKTKKAIILGLKSFENILPQFLCIIITVGILLSFFNTDTISKILGNSSGFWGIILADIIGSITMMPTFVAFSLGNTLLLNGAGYSQVGALVSSLVLIGLMTFPLEAKYIGKRAAFLRNLIAFLFSIIVGIILGRIMVFI
ncbi:MULTISPECIES: permease [unclassified Clostridium]|uniref:permease n=1 Tax=unclassified Clostridium TaxID=2614128 RepID=UPI00189AAA2C|nr:MULTISPECIES: permease [unclassified Clostridium]MBP3915750.1 permease [Clostridium sp.]MEE0933508.1 permease [Clostridium sp.]